MTIVLTKNATPSTWNIEDCPTPSREPLLKNHLSLSQRKAVINIHA